MLDTGLIQPLVRKLPAIEMRVARVPALQVLIVDGLAAMVTTPAPPGRQTSAVRAASFTATLGKLFDGLWDQAVDVEDRIDLDEYSQLRAPAEILEGLRAGVTDEVAARELSISVRTYRRYVAEIMKLLGANSRFQAGVRAAELGLLPGSPGLPLTAAPHRGGDAWPRGGSR
ncbi:response regulator transcription factor [Streptomyces sp. NPDC058953]